MTIENDEFDETPGHVIIEYLARRKIRIAHIAEKAGFAPSILYNLKKDPTRGISADTLFKLSEALNVSVYELTGRGAPVAADSDESANSVPVVGILGARGRIFDLSPPERTSLPKFSSSMVRAIAARVDGDSLSPIPNKWIIYFSASAESPEALFGVAAMIQFQGATNMVLGTLRRGTSAGRYTIDPWVRGSPLEDVEVTAIHRILGFCAPDF